MMDAAPHSPPTPPRRSLLVAVEGADGTGKTTLCAALGQALSPGALIIKRPAPGSLASRLLQDALAHGPHAMHDGRIQRAMDDDAAAALMVARSFGPGSVTLLDRHWLSAVVENYPDPERALATQRARHGEPDLWVICTADWRTVQARLAARGGVDARQTVEGIAGRLARYEWLAERLTAPVVIVEPACVHLPECARMNNIYTPAAAAVYIAAHIRYLQEHP